MDKSISDKIYIILLYGNIRIWLNHKEFEIVEKLLETGKTFLNIDGRIFNTKNIIYAGPRIEIDIADRIKRGEWQCKFCKRWHPRNEECGCQGGKY